MDRNGSQVKRDYLNNGLFEERAWNGSGLLIQGNGAPCDDLRNKKSETTGSNQIYIGSAIKIATHEKAVACLSSQP